MNPTIEALRAALTSALDDAAAALGETTDLSIEDQDQVSRVFVDAVNATWNPNLPPRP